MLGMAEELLADNMQIWTAAVIPSFSTRPVLLRGVLKIKKGPSKMAFPSLLNQNHGKLFMRYKTVYSLLAKLIDHDGSDVRSKEVYQTTDGFACTDDCVLNYAELPFAEECDLRRGFPRIVLDEKGRLSITVEVDSKRQLSNAELRELKADFEGQLTDGIGAGCFDAMTTTGISVQLKTPLKATCKQQEGEAWKPIKSTAKGNERRIAAIQQQVDAEDTKTDSNSPVSSKVKMQVSTTKVAKPNFSKLLRLLAKVDREFNSKQIEAELAALGGDLSHLTDGTFPSGNFREPKFLRLLLKAGLPPESLDSKGQTLLYQAAGSPACLEIMLKQNVDVNRANTDYFGYTPLMRAASLGNLKCVQMLLDAGADAKATNASGDTALDEIDSHSHDRKAIAALLKKKTAKR